MEITITTASEEAIKPLRLLFLHENRFQFIFNKCHDYGWCDNYLFYKEGTAIGYGSVWGNQQREDRDTIFEYYIIAGYRQWTNVVFEQFIQTCGAILIQSQSNDAMLTGMLYNYGKNINVEAILFEDHFQSELYIPGAILHKQPPPDSRNIDMQYVLELAGETVAQGGLMLNYNMPYADLYYEVKAEHRHKGLGAFFAQLLKQQAYAMARLPAARCDISNNISKAVLLKAGFRVCGQVLGGTVKVI